MKRKKYNLFQKSNKYKYNWREKNRKIFYKEAAKKETNIKKIDRSQFQYKYRENLIDTCYRSKK